MNEILASPYLILFARLCLGGVLLVAGVGKLIEHNPAAVIAEVNFLPLPLARVAARLLPYVEVSIGGLLVVGLLTPFAAAVAAAMFAVFSVVVGSKVLRGKRENCHCFGSFSADTLNWAAFGRNLLLLVFALLLAFSTVGYIALDYIVLGRKGSYPSATDGIIVFIMAALAVALIVFGGRALGYIKQTLQAA